MTYLDNKDFGDFAKYEISITYVKSMLIQNALFYYNTCIDLSWQVLYLFYEWRIADKLPTNQLYDKVLKECNSETLSYNLTLACQSKLKEQFVNYFFNKPIVRKIRENYNYLKHRGTFYFPGLGMNDANMGFLVQNKQLPVISRKAIDYDEWLADLLEFDKEFEIYFSPIVTTVVPHDYLDGTMSLVAPVCYYLNHKDEIYNLPD